MSSAAETSVVVVVVVVISILTTLAAVAGNSVKDMLKDYCQGESFRPQCSHDEVILMQKAIYGRMKLGRCIKLDMGYIGCKNDVLDLVDERCSGQRSCNINVPDLTLEATQPCLELKSYLEASYSCIKVLTVDSNDCRSTRPLQARLPSGRIASVTAHESRCTSRQDTVWAVHALPGQRVNISLLDFNAAAHLARRVPTPPTDADAPHASYNQPCHKYATIVEPLDTGALDTLDQTGRTTVICGRRARSQHVYTSRGHLIHLQLEMHRISPDYFVLSYEVFGCADPPIANNVWFKRFNDDEAEMGCRVTPEKWRVTCVNQQWSGNFINCTHYETIELAVRSSTMDTSSNAGVLTTVLCLCALLIALIIVIVGIVLCRRHRRPPQHSRRGTSTGGKSGGRGAGVGGGGASLGGDLSPRVVVRAPSKSECSAIEDYDERGEVTSYVWPSKNRSRLPQRSVSEVAGYDVVDGCGGAGGGAGGSICTTRSDAYEKVSNCRYEHIWQMPLPKAPDE